MRAVIVVKAAGLVVLSVFMQICGEGSYAAEPQGMPKPFSTLVPEIVGGEKVSYSRAPWQVALVSSTGSPVEGVFCGGTLIDSQWVLTAAHCFYDVDTCAKIPKQAMFVAYGSADLGYKVSLIAPKELFHPKEYSCSSKDFDIALIQLVEPVSVTTPIQLASAVNTVPLVKPGTRLMALGWGLTEVDGWKSRYLMEVKLPIVSNDECRAVYGPILPMTAICAGEVGKDACTGDSGGALYQRQGADQAIQVGVVSFGEGCGKAKTPGVYTAVVDHLAWIQETRKPKPCTLKDIAEKRC